jgi:PhnB protein
MQISPYLFFNGNCEEALEFYHSAFGGDVEINRYGGSPMANQVPNDWQNKIMHATFTSGDATFMASDVSPAHKVAQGSSIAMSIGTNDEASVDRIFAKLSEGGTVEMPLEKTFWGAKFGMLKDKFGVEWMVNCMLDAHQ